jgi:hypothetical protein
MEWRKRGGKSAMKDVLDFVGGMILLFRVE